MAACFAKQTWTRATFACERPLWVGSERYVAPFVELQVHGSRTIPP